MKKLVIIFILLLPLSSAYLEDVLLFDLNIYQNDTVVVNRVAMVRGRQTVFPETDMFYYAKLLDGERNVLFKANLPVTFDVFVQAAGDGNFQSKEEMKLEEVNVFFRISNIDEATHLIIYHHEEVITSLSLADYLCNDNGVCEDFKGESPYRCSSECAFKDSCGNNKCDGDEDFTSCPTDCPRPKISLCGNSVCNPAEDHVNCPSDCPTGSADANCDGIADDICDPDCSGAQDPDCRLAGDKPGASPIKFILAGVFLVLTFGAFAFLYFKMRS